MVSTTAQEAPSDSRNIPALRQRIAAIFMIGFAIILMVLASRFERQSALFWAFGLAFGFTLQRSRFCYASAFRDLFLMQQGRVMKGILSGMAIATLGFTVLMSRILPMTLPGLLPPQAHVSPIALSLILGGVLFGIGMVLAGGCVSGSLYRIGEGYLASGVALLGILGGLLAASHTWNWWWRVSTNQGLIIWLPERWGYGVSALLTLLLILGIYLFIVWWESRSGLFFPETQKGSSSGLPFGEQVKAIFHRWFVTPWSAVTGGIALGTMNVFIYVADHPLRITGELAVWSATAARLVGLGPPPLLGVESLAGCTLDSGGGGLISHMTFLVVGLVVGSLIAALLAHEFKVRSPRQHTRLRYGQSLGGGLLMGYGSGIAIGCTVGAFFSAIPSLGLNGWVFALTLSAGAWLGVKAIRRLP